MMMTDTEYELTVKEVRAHIARTSFPAVTADLGDVDDEYEARGHHAEYGASGGY